MKRTKATEAAEATEEETVVWMLGKVPKTLKNKFMALCRLKDKSAREMVIELVSDYIKDNPENITF